MTKFLKVSFVAALLSSAACFPAFAQSAGDTEMRLNQMEDQMRQLVGQVEQLTFTVKQLQSQVAASRKQTGQAEPAQLQPVKPLQPLKKAAVAAPQPAQLDAAISQQPVEEQAPAAIADNGGLEQIEDVAAGSDQAPAAPAPAPQKKVATISGGLSTTKAAAPDDGGFQGQVLVAPGGEPVADGNSAAAGPSDTSDGLENVALQTEDPQSIYRKANESLVDRQYDAAEQGFSNFLQKYPTHSLAGSAQYWLGETYFAQGDYRTAAKNFLMGYQNYPKSRRAPDSLLRLGISLAKMGEKDKACSSFGAISTEFPNAVDVKKRAQAEFRRAGC